MQQNILVEKGKLFLSWTDIEDLVQELWKKCINPIYFKKQHVAVTDVYLFTAS